jgi:hypothetical protein
MSTTLEVHRPAIQPAFRLTLKRFVFDDEGRVIYAADEAEARRILDSGL